MTNEQAKQEAIKKAYGDSWDLVKEFCDEEGWITNKWVAHGSSVGISYEDAGYNSDQITIKQYNSSDSSWRSRTIYSILTNNGWTRIEPDGSNLPVDDWQGNFITVRIDGLICDETIAGRLVNHRFKNKVITHYKPIEKELLPIY